MHKVAGCFEDGLYCTDLKIGSSDRTFRSAIKKPTRKSDQSGILAGVQLERASHSRNAAVESNRDKSAPRGYFCPRGNAFVNIVIFFVKIPQEIIGKIRYNTNKVVQAELPIRYASHATMIKY